MSAKATLLVVDDEPGVRDVLDEYFTARGYAVIGAADAGAARSVAASHAIDLALVDVAMPGEDGLTLAAHLRERYGSIGIVMLTSAATALDRTVGLEVGADDYVVKPFHPRELEARVRSVLRRTSSSRRSVHAAGKVRIGRCVLDLAARQLVDDDGNAFALSALDFDLLKVLAASPNQPVSRERMLGERRADWSPFDRSVDIRIMRLRRRIEPDPTRPRFIRTLRNAGYLFVPDGGQGLR